jgi:hypothetical protein
MLIVTGAIEAVVPAIHHFFSSHGKEIQFTNSTHCCILAVAISKLLSLDVISYWSNKWILLDTVHDILNEIAAVDVLQEWLYGDQDCYGEVSLCVEARAFHPSGFFQFFHLFLV